LNVTNTDASNLPSDPTVQSDVSAMFDNPDNSVALTLGNNSFFGSLDLSAAPEPATWLSLATGLVGLGLLKFRRGAIAR
jgi:hypothetical protein